MSFYLSIYDAPKRVHDSAFLINELRGSKGHIIALDTHICCQLCTQIVFWVTFTVYPYRNVELMNFMILIGMINERSCSNLPFPWWFPFHIYELEKILHFKIEHNPYIWICLIEYHGHHKEQFYTKGFSILCLYRERLHWIPWPSQITVL